MTYMSLLVLFIPLFKFSKRYFAELNGKVYELEQEIGKALERGEEPDLNLGGAQPFDVNQARREMQEFEMQGFGQQFGQQTENAGTMQSYSRTPQQNIRIIKGKMCMRCGFKTKDMSLTHCPECENKLVYDD